MTTLLDALVIDMGGTNIRLGLLAQNLLVPQYVETYEIDAFPSLADVISLFLSKAPPHAIKQACIDVATPVTGDLIKLTNHDWSFSISAIGQQFGFQRVKVINDFTALALSIPLLSPNELKLVGQGSADPDGTIGLLGPGTGLGVSGLVRSAAGLYPISGEGGHVTIGARNARELAIFSAFWERYGHMSAERLLSGTGLEEIYVVIAKLNGIEAEPLLPEEISARAVNKSCPICIEVMNMFCEWLGIVSANLVLTLGATGGLYIGGGIVPKLGDYFIKSNFREMFETKGRFQHFMRGIPVYIINADQPALRGAASALSVRFERIGLTWRA